MMGRDRSYVRIDVEESSQRLFGQNVKRVGMIVVDMEELE